MSAVRKSAYAVPVPEEAVRADHPGFSFGTFRDPPGRVWADFTHAEDEFVVVAEGEVAVTVGSETAICGPGDLVLIPAGVPHTLRTSDAAGSVWHYGYGTFRGPHG
jgi:quercetin dioxygenase-like cupin family protein